MKTFIYTAD